MLLLGVADVAATKRFYLEHGLTVARFGRKYVEFDAPPKHIKLALYGRRALAKDAGVPVEGSGSHRIVIAATRGFHRPGRVCRWQAARSPLAETESAPQDTSSRP